MKDTMKDTIICDLDGTLFGIEHRRHHVAKVPGKKRDFKAFEAAIPQDTVNEAVFRVIQDVVEMRNHPDDRFYRVVFVTGRHERTREMTEEAIAVHCKWYPSSDYTLHMRPDTDNRADNIFKQEVLDTKLDKDRILFCLDDRQQVVDMWRRNGLTCFQVAEGNF